MKRIITSALMQLMSVMLLVVASFAWATTSSTGVYRTQPFNASQPEVLNYIYIGQSNSARGSQTYTSVVSDMSLKPCTTTNYDTWKWEDGNTLSYMEKSQNVISESLFFNSEAQYSGIRIANINVTGAGSLAPAIRVAAVAVGVGDTIVASTQGSSGQLGIVTRNAYRPVNIYIWIEGTDPACTYENIASAGAITVEVTFEGIS